MYMQGTFVVIICGTTTPVWLQWHHTLHQEIFLASIYHKLCTCNVDFWDMLFSLSTILAAGVAVDVSHRLAMAKEGIQLT